MSIQTESRVQPMIDRYLQAKPRLCTERASLATRSYQESEGEPEIVRAAKAIAAVLNGIRVWIDEDELLVGHWASVFRGIPLWPEFGRGDRRKWDSLTKAGLFPWSTRIPGRNSMTFLLTGKAETTRIGVVRVLPEEVNAARQATLWYWHLGVVGNRRGRYLIDLPTVLNQGFKGIRETATRKLDVLDLEEPGAMKRQLFYRAVIIICNAVADFSQRYAAKAVEMSTGPDGTREKELKEIARVCARVPFEPAETFYEALQSAWFTFLIANLETGGDSISFGGLDQILHPYYQADVDQGRLTRNEARELLEEFLFKVNEKRHPLSGLRRDHRAPDRVWSRCHQRNNLSAAGRVGAGAAA